MEFISQTPSRSWKMWVACLIMYFSSPLFSHHYYNSMFNKGAYSPDADSFFIGTMQDVYGTVILFPFYLIFIYFILRKYPGKQPLLSWNQSRPFWSCLWSLVFGLLIILDLWSVPHIIEWGLPVEALRIFIWIWLYILLRAIIINKNLTSQPKKTARAGLVEQSGKTE